MTYFTLADKYGTFDFNYFFNISLKHRFMYVEVPKCGCTAIKRALNPLELDQRGPDWCREEVIKNPHRDPVSSPFIRPFQLGHDLFDQLMQDDQFFKFTVVRDPFARALSGYIDKILTGLPQLNNLRTEIAQAKNIEASAVDGYNVSFPEFLRAVRDKKDHMKVDPHFRLQSAQISADIVKYTRIFKLENMHELTSDLEFLPGMPSVKFDKKSNHLTNSRERISDYYNNQAMNLVLEIYDRDFVQFGYPRDLDIS